MRAVVEARIDQACIDEALKWLMPAVGGRRLASHETIVRASEEEMPRTRA